MEIKDLEYFMVICKHQNIARAARSLYITPQGLSKIVRNIEAELGTTLLHRTGNGITLTDSGQYLSEHLPEFLNSYQHLCNEIGNRALKHVDATAMEKFEVKLMVHRDNPLSQKAAAEIQDLGKYPLYIESTEFNIHHDILGRCQAAGVTPNIAFESSGFSLCQKMVSKNKGISVIVDFISDDMQNSNLVLLPFADGPYYWETYMLTRRGEKPNPDILTFRDFIMDWMHKIKCNEIQR